MLEVIPIAYQLAAATEEGQTAAQRGKGQAFSFNLLYPSFLLTQKALILPTAPFSSHQDLGSR